MADIHYHWGHNIKGKKRARRCADESSYLPMAATFDEAKRGLIDDIKFHEDHAAMAEDGEGLAEELSAAAQDVNLWSGPDYLVVTDPARAHDLGIAYWVTECAEEECMADEEEGEVGK